MVINPHMQFHIRSLRLFKRYYCLFRPTMLNVTVFCHRQCVQDHKVGLADKIKDHWPVSSVSIQPRYSPYAAVKVSHLKFSETLVSQFGQLQAH